MTGGFLAQNFKAMLLGPQLSMTGDKTLGSMLVELNKGLLFMKDIIEAGRVKPVIDRYYPLSETAEAFRYYGERHARRKVVITMEHGKEI